MSHRWLLSLLCLSLLAVTLVHSARARGEVKVDEALTRLALDKDPIELLLAVANQTGKSHQVIIQLELLDPQDTIKSQTSATRTISAGNQNLKVFLPAALSNFNDVELHRILWYRLRYRITSGDSPEAMLAEGIVSLSEITPDLFNIRIVTSGIARGGQNYRARIQTTHPITQRPVADVRVEGEVTLEHENHPVKLTASKNTDAEGYALLEFALPSYFPQFPHNPHPAGGDIRVAATKGPIVARAEAQILVDQFPRILINSDKPLYQPGQVMHMRALVFTPSQHAVANQNIVIRISDPEDLTVFRTMVKSSRFGVAHADWLIPENARLGDYRVSVSVDGSEQMGSDAQVRISRYELPNFSVTVKADRDYYLPSQDATVEVRADYLFGKPVKHGRVRVVSETDREWNYREQKWESVEGDVYEGETDAGGVFSIRINLAKEHEELEDSDDVRFKDITYAAYFTDTTTNRTEHRRFDLRVTKEAIHVYLLNNDRSINGTLPLSFYVSTFYADGSPARGYVNVRVSPDEELSGGKTASTNPTFIKVKTNRYGLAKASLRLPREFEDEIDVKLIVSAVDSAGRAGSITEEISLDDEEMIRVETDKALYKPGEPVKVLITSSVPNQTVTVDLARQSSVIRSKRVQLRNGRGSVTFAYAPDFKDKLTVAAYGNSPNTALGVRSILYPQDPDLKIGVRTSKRNYRPGEEAQVDISVDAPQGGPAESALGVVVLDKAVEERFRSDYQSGRGAEGAEVALLRFMGLHEQISGVSLRDLHRVDFRKTASPELNLLAEILLNRSRDYSPEAVDGSEYETSQLHVFGESLKRELKPIADALAARYSRTAEHPANPAELDRILTEARIDLNAFKDPWETVYRTRFHVEAANDVLTFISAGADKRFDTSDDFSIERFTWPYFRPLGEKIGRAVHRYHERTGNFIRDYARLREELLEDGVDLNLTHDRWGKQYRFDFVVEGSNYVIKVLSGGPDKQFSTGARYYSDDFVIWQSSIDYFSELRDGIEAALKQNLSAEQNFPQTDRELHEALRNSPYQLDNLRDPWDRTYYATFTGKSISTSTVKIENRADFNQVSIQRPEVTPVTRVVEFIDLRSMGRDGQIGTGDDFTLATFSRIAPEQEHGDFQPKTAVSEVLLSGSAGTLRGVVSDLLGARIPGVSVTATRTQDGRKYDTTSNDEGRYSFASLPAGFYEVRFEAQGFMASVFTNVVVRPFDFVELNVILRVGIVAETVTVNASSGNLDVVYHTSSSMQRRQIMSLKLITKPGGSQEVSTPRLREYFPETLVWKPSLETDLQGRARLNFKLADNITTWTLAVVGSTEDGRIGFTETPITVFQPFFVEHDPPRVLTEGDQISLPVVVRNYLDEAQKVELEIKSESWFSLIGPSRKQTVVAANEAARETFEFRAIASIKDGKQRIDAGSSGGSDAIQKPITVHPDGEEISVNAGDILYGSAALDLHLPEQMIPNSQRAELKIYPNLLAHVIESVEGIMARPYGCGEQTISSTYPSLLLLRYHKHTGDDFPSRALALRYLQQGYSRLLNYRDESGGFSYWGQGEPDLALTAYALRFLNDAAEIISVDRNVIDGTRKWLIRQQVTDGSWAYSNSTNDRLRNAVLTAYVTHMLARTASKVDSGASREISDSEQRAFAFLDRLTEEFEEPYLLASHALAAFAAGETPRARKLVDKLRSMARTEGSTTYWALETHTPFYGWGLAGRIETTALVVQALARSCDSKVANCDPPGNLINSGLLFLLKQKDRYGVWHSTQATINVLDAMLELLSAHSPQQDSPENSLAAEILVNGRLVQTVQIPAKGLVAPEILDITQALSVGDNRVEIRRLRGGPFASVKALASYYVPWTTANVESKTDHLRLSVKFDTAEGKINDEMSCFVEAGRVGGGYGMILAEIGLPPGADVDRNSLEKAIGSSRGAINRYDVLPDRVVVYLWPQAGSIKFDFKFRPRFAMTAKNSPSLIYDYYNPEVRATVAPVIFKIR